MSLDACIPQLLAEGKLTPEQAEDATRIYGRAKRLYQGRMADSAAEALASERAVEAFERKARLTKRQTLLQVAAQKKALETMASYDRGSGKDPAAAALALLVRDDRARYSSIESRHVAVRAQALAGLNEFLVKHSRGAVGQLRDKAGLMDLVHEAFGEDSGNQSAKAFNEAWQASAEWLRQRRNAAGGDTGKLADWGMPQSHDSLSVMQAGLDAWREFTLPLLDRARMVDGATGLPMDDAQLHEALEGVQRQIATDGWATRDPGVQIGGGKLANRRADHRFLIFRDARSWIDYQERFGGAGTPFDVMMRHIDHVSQEIAMMEILGPNPAATVRWLKDGLAKRAALGTDILGRDQAHTAGRKIDGIFNELTGANAAPENRAIALGFSTVRSFQTATKLGSAVLSASGDLANQAVTRLYNGLPIVGMMNGYVRQLASGRATADAIRMGLGAEDMARAIGSDTRYTLQDHGAEVTRRMAETVLKISGLDAVTRAGRFGFGMDAVRELTNESVKGWAHLDGRFRAMLDRYGIGEAEWDAVRSTPLEEERGVPWLKPLAIERPELRDRVLEMILAETDMAVPTPGLRVRAAVNGQLAKGTWGGELARSAFQFKGFGLSMMAANWRRMMATSSIGGKIGYALGYTALTTAIGVLTIQLRDVVKGLDPEPVDGPSLWVRGLFQGGAFGIYGDFVNSSQSRTGGGVMDALAGPMWGDINQVGKVTAGDAFADFQGKHTNRGRELQRLALQENPLGSLWYTRLAYERLLQHWLQEQVDPAYPDAYARMEQRAADQRQSYWWHPGDTAPERAPDVGNVAPAGAQ